jgi:toxin ParE1/3/4
MSRFVIFRSAAVQDVKDTFRFLNDRNPQAAAKFLKAVEFASGRLARMPGMGRRWMHGEQHLPEVRSVRTLGFEAWLMLYADREGAIHVLRVVHGARDLDAGLDIGSDLNL